MRPFLAVIALSALVVLSLLPLADAQATLSIITRYSNNQIPAEELWNGGETISLKLTGNTWKSSEISGRETVFAKALLKETGIAKTYGWNNMIDTLIPDNSAVAKVSSREYKITLSPCPGYVHASDVTVRVEFTGAAQTVYLTTNAVADDKPAATDMTIKGNAGPGRLSYFTNSTNFNDVAFRPIYVRVELQYDSFLDRDEFPVIGSGSQVFPQVTAKSSASQLHLNWVWTYVNGYTVEGVRPALGIGFIDAFKNEAPTDPFFFDILVGDIKTQYRKETSVANRPEPKERKFYLTNIKDSPVAYCVLDNTTVTEEELRAGAVNRTIIFAPQTADEEFRLDQNEQWDLYYDREGQLMVSKVDGLRLSFEVVSTTAVNVVINATVANFDTDISQAISLKTPVQFLRSKIAGCGETTLTVMPSPGTLRREAPVELDETAFNDGDVELILQLDYDKFEPSRVRPFLTVSQVIVDGSKVDGITRGALEYLSDRLEVNVSSDFSYVVVKIRKTLIYNIPEGLEERITIQFDGNSTRSGLAPTPFSPTIIVKGIQPTISLIVIPTGNRTLPMEMLWAGRVEVGLRIRGEVWDKTKESVWNAYHPVFTGAFEGSTADSFSAFHTTATPYVDYENRQILCENNVTGLGCRDCRLDIKPMVGLSLPFPERVTITTVTQMIEGSVNSAITRTDFEVVPVQPVHIEVDFYQGDVGPKANITEEDARGGLNFSFRVTNVGLSASVIKAPGAAARMFPISGSLSPWLHLATIELDSIELADKDGAKIQVYTHAHVTLPRMPEFDITVDEEIPIVIPDDFYLFSKPVTPAGTSVRINSLPSPSCFINDVETITEGDIRNRSMWLRIEVTQENQLEPFVPDIVEKFLLTDPPVPSCPANQSCTAPPSQALKLHYRTTHMDKYPIDIQFAGIGTSNRGNQYLRIEIKPNSSYEIVRRDTVSVEFPATYFRDGEACATRVDFTIAVLPGILQVAFDNITEAGVRANETNITMTFIDESVIGDAFNVSLEHRSGGTSTDPSTTMRHYLTYRDTPLTAYRVPGPSEVFVVTIPPIPQFDIYTDEVLQIVVPSSKLESGKPPSPYNDMITIRISPGTINSTFNNTILETDVSRGFQRVTLQLQDEDWNSVALTSVRRATLDGLPNSDERSEIIATLPPEAFTIDPADTRTMHIVFRPNFNFDSVTNYTFAVRVPNATLSGLTPEPAIFSIVVMPVDGNLVIDGSTVTGSRHLVLGGVQVRLTLENDLFVRGQLSDRDLCPKPVNEPNLMQLNCESVPSVEEYVRQITINFPEDPSFIISRNTTYIISIPTAAIKSGQVVNNVTMLIYVEAGVLKVVDKLVGVEFTEEQFREQFRGKDSKDSTVNFEVEGDRFNQRFELFIEALARGCTSTPAGNPYGFCARVPFLFHEKQLQTSPTVYNLNVQPDEDFDVAQTETVTINVAGIGMASGLQPAAGVQQFTILPQPGQYFFSVSKTSVYAREIAMGTSEVDITLTLYGERWMPNPTLQVINSFTSSSSTAREPNGFTKWKANMFYTGSVSENGRVLTLRMRAWPDYSIAQTETITFAVGESAVLSGLRPTARSRNNQLTVTASVSISLITPTAFSADQLKGQGVNVTMVVSGASDFEGITPTMFQRETRSLSSPVLEPNGYAAMYGAGLIDVARGNTESLSQISMVIKCTSPNYELRNAETLRISVPNSWITGSVEPFPQYFDIRIDPTLKTIVLVVPTAAYNEQELRESLAKYAGVETQTVQLQQATPYGDIFGRYTEVTVYFTPSNTPGERSPEETVSVLVNSKPLNLKDCCNIDVLYDAAAPMSRRQVDEALGFQERQELVEQDNDLTWVWVLIAALCIAMILGAMKYYRERDTLSSGMNREVNLSTAEIFSAKLILNAQPDEQGNIMYRSDAGVIRTKDFAATIDTSDQLKSLNEEEDERERGLPTLAKVKSKQRIDIDETLKVSQPKSVFGKRVQVLDLPVPGPAPKLQVEDFKSVYPPDAPFASKFRPKRPIDLDEI